MTGFASRFRRQIFEGFVVLGFLFSELFSVLQHWRQVCEINRQIMACPKPLRRQIAEKQNFYYIYTSKLIQLPDVAMILKFEKFVQIIFCPSPIWQRTEKSVEWNRQVSTRICMGGRDNSVCRA
jgi:hypothetical protein